MPENAQKTKTEEDHTAMTEEADKDSTGEETIDMTDMTGIFKLNSDAIEIGNTEIDMIETIVMIETTEEGITKEIEMTETVTEMTDEEIAPGLTLIQNHPQKAVIVVIERKENKEEDVLEAE